MILGMSTLTIDLDDDAARLVQEAARAVDQSVTEWLRQKVCEAAAASVKRPAPTPGRISPLHPGAMQAAPDFNAPMEEFAAYV
jgi:hypothetical protein